MVIKINQKASEKGRREAGQDQFASVVISFSSPKVQGENLGNKFARTSRYIAHWRM